MGNIGELSRIVVIGTGLIGTSVALAMRERGAEVLLDDRDPACVRLAAEIGAGVALRDGDEPADLAVLAVPPSAVAATLPTRRSATRPVLHRRRQREVPPAARGRSELGCDLTRFVAGHPLAGRESSGPAAARGDLFLGRPWALCPTPEVSAETTEAVGALVKACGAQAVVVDAAEHDRAVALVSHGPHVAAAAVAARLEAAPEVALGLAGQGVRDVTRIAAGDPGLWIGILSANALPVADVIDEVAKDLAATARCCARAANPRSPGCWSAAVPAAAGSPASTATGRAPTPSWPS